MTLKSRETSLRWVFLLSLPAVTFAACASPPPWEFEAGDHVVIIGNALADRMQHDGWLEAYLQTELPDLELVIRNQGFSGDRIDHRPRSEGFPSADDYLGLSQATVIFAMFGYNESYDADPAGFASALGEWIDHTRAQDYSGDGPPRIVLFSPIAHEDLHDPNLPDGSENNERLAAYSDAMAGVAVEKGAFFVDLYGPSQALYAAAASPLTINGIHLTSDGNRQIADVIVRALQPGALVPELPTPIAAGAFAASRRLSDRGGAHGGPGQELALGQPIPGHGWQRRLGHALDPGVHRRSDELRGPAERTRTARPHDREPRSRHLGRRARRNGATR